MSYEHKCQKYLYKLSKTAPTDSKFGIYLSKINYWNNQIGGTDECKKNKNYFDCKKDVYFDPISRQPGDKKCGWDHLNDKCVGTLECATINKDNKFKACTNDKNNVREIIFTTALSRIQDGKRKDKKIKDVFKNVETLGIDYANLYRLLLDYVTIPTDPNSVVPQLDDKTMFFKHLENPKLTWK